MTVGLNGIWECGEVVTISASWIDKIQEQHNKLWDFTFVINSRFQRFEGDGRREARTPVRPPYTPENFQHTACLGTPLQVCIGCIFDDEGVKPTVGANVGPSTVFSGQSTVGEGNVEANLYLNGGFVFPFPGGLTFSTPIDHPIRGFSGSDKNLGTPSVGVGVQYVFPALKGTTKRDWDHHRDNPRATHKFLSPVGRCVD